MGAVGAGSIRLRNPGLQEAAVGDTIERFEDTGSPVISDGEQTKSSFVTYPLEGLRNLAPDGAVVPFADGHSSQLPVSRRGRSVTAGTRTTYLTAATRYARCR